MLICFAMICSCQKHGSAAERQLAQRKAELDAREKALDEREKALAERENATGSARTISPDLQSRRQVRDPAQVQAERDSRLEQLPPDARQLIIEPSRVKSGKDEKDRRMQERLARRQRRLEEQQTMGTSRPEVSPEKKAEPPSLAAPPAGGRGAAPPAADRGAAPPAAVATPPTQLAIFPSAESPSPSPSPTPQ
jgi:hypothetical protein